MKNTKGNNDEDGRGGEVEGGEDRTRGGWRCVDVDLRKNGLSEEEMKNQAVWRPCQKR